MLHSEHNLHPFGGAVKTYRRHLHCNDSAALFTVAKRWQQPACRWMGGRMDGQVVVEVHAMGNDAALKGRRI